MTSPDEAARRASRVLRWYPEAWRSRYGEEFAELLIADISERPRSRTRTADVVRGGIDLGLSDEPELAELDRAVRAHLTDPRTLTLAHLLVVTWGRKPAA